ncbi:MAG: PAS domain-containing protein [Chloroflexi bacterium]|nr:PAS domain-containing protein [Chloroflexota bacterium]
MHWQYNQYSLLSLIAGVISVTLIVYIWQRRTTPGAMAFLVLMLTVAVWSVGSFLELGSAGLSTKVFWAKIQQLGMSVLPIAWLSFALLYTGRSKWLTRRRIIGLAVLPVITLLLVWTNHAHHLFWRDIRLDSSGPFPMMVSDRGVWFWVDLTYSYFLISIGIYCMIQAYIRASSPYRAQAGVLLVGAIAPLAASLLSLSNLDPFTYMDTTPFGFTVSGLALAWGLFLLRLLDVVPVARDSVIRDMPDAMIVINTSNRVVDLNPAAEEILGQPATEIVGQPATNVLEGCLDFNYESASISEKHLEIVVSKDQSQTYYELNISPIFEKNSRLAGRLVILRDITEHKQVEDTIRHRLEFEKTISIISSRLVGVSDMDQAVYASLQDIGEFSGATRSHLLFLPKGKIGIDSIYEWCADGVPPRIGDLTSFYATSLSWWMDELRERHVISIADVSQMPECTQIEKCQLDHYGIASLFMVPGFVEKELAGFVSLENVAHPEKWTTIDLMLLRTFADIMGSAFERKHSEDRIKEANAELCKAMDQLKDSQAQLMQSEKLAAIGQLISGVAHELNNPLMVISGTAELMLTYVENEIERDDLQNLHNNTLRAISIVSNLLSFARKHEPEMKYVSINDVIESVITLRSYELNLDGIEIITELDPTLPNTLADFPQLQQVFLNLLINAEQAMKESNGEGRLLIQTQTVGETIQVEFTDNGPGVPGEILSHIFEPFFTTKDVGKGTGLGLSICYGIIQEHKGQISVESSEGKGTIFRVELPILGRSVGCVS